VATNLGRAIRDIGGTSPDPLEVEPSDDRNGKVGRVQSMLVVRKLGCIQEKGNLGQTNRRRIKENKILWRKSVKFEFSFSRPPFIGTVPIFWC